jgi:hypothetical protein
LPLATIIAQKCERICCWRSSADDAIIVIRVISAAEYLARKEGVATPLRNASLSHVISEIP